MKRALFLLSQPPGTSGVQGSRWAKLLPFLHSYDWSIDFVGPDPKLNSVIIENVDLYQNHCHFTRHLPLSRKFAVKRYRQPRSSPMFWSYAFLQVLFRSIERLIGLNENEYLAAGVISCARQACTGTRFDLICAASPPFFYLEQARWLALEQDLPLLVFYEDPHGAREVGQFWPSEPEKQSRLLADADCAVFASPLTRDRYVQAELVPESRSRWVSDSFPTQHQLRSLSASCERQDSEGCRLVHLGNIPAWRNIDILLDVLSSLSSSSQCERDDVYLDNYGFLYPEAIAKVKSDPSLSRLVRQVPAVSHLQSHQVAADADLLLIVIGRRHTDNLPSKVFEYLVHSKPLLVIGPIGNPLQSILADIPVGIFCDIDEYGDIDAGLRRLINQRAMFIHAFSTHAEELARRFSAESVAKKWTTFFDQAVVNHQRQKR